MIFRQALLVLMASMVLIPLVGCQTLAQQSQRSSPDAGAAPYGTDPAEAAGCRFAHRDLTVDWEQRTYWCDPLSS